MLIWGSILAKEWDISEAKGATKGFSLFGIGTGTRVESGIWFSLSKDLALNRRQTAGEVSQERGCLGWIPRRSLG